MSLKNSKNKMLNLKICNGFLNFKSCREGNDFMNFNDLEKIVLAPL